MQSNRVWPWPQLLCMLLLLMTEGMLFLMWSLEIVQPSPRWIGRITALDLTLACWLIFTWWTTRRWYWLTFGLLVAGVGAGGGFWAAGMYAASTAILGGCCMGVALTIGLFLIKGALSPGTAVTGVARTVIDEAIRMKIAVVFMVGLVVLIPALPFVLDPAELLKYRIQFFLTWALSTTTALLSLMTVFLACGTICNEVTRRQVHLTLTKPVGRGSYLLGKWLGISALNLLLLGVAVGGVYFFSKFLQHQEARDAIDRVAVDKQVLVSRIAVPPKPPAGIDLEKLYQLRIKRLEETSVSGDSNASSDPRIKKQLRQAVIAKWHTIAPLESQQFVFRGLSDAAQFGPWVQLRFKPKASQTPADERVRLWVKLRSNESPRRLALADGHYHTLDLPVSAIDEEGDLVLTITNPADPDDPEAIQRSSISFTPGDGLSLLYQVGHFGPNLLNAMAIHWVKLSFLAMVGLTAGTFLGFPVACMVSLLVLIAGTASGFLIESLEYYASLPLAGQSATEQAATVWGALVTRIGQGEVWQAIKILIRLIGSSFVVLIPALSDYNPVPMIADGRLVDHRIVTEAAVKVGVIWTGCFAAIAWVVFRKRELAEITV